MSFEGLDVKIEAKWSGFAEGREGVVLVPEGFLKRSFGTDLAISMLELLEMIPMSGNDLIFVSPRDGVSATACSGSDCLILEKRVGWFAGRPPEKSAPPLEGRPDTGRIEDEGTQKSPDEGGKTSFSS